MFLNDDAFFLSLRNVIKKMHGLGDRAMGAYGMSHAEMRLLLLLYGADGCSQEHIASRQNVDPTNVGRSLKKLETLGYIRRTRSREDGRANLVFLTDRGRDIRETVLAIKADIEAKATRNISREELELVSRILGKMDEGLSGEI